MHFINNLYVQTVAIQYVVLFCGGLGEPQPAQQRRSEVPRKCGYTVFHLAGGELQKEYNGFKFGRSPK